VAVTDLFPLIVTVQALLFPLQAPDQPPKVELGSEMEVKVTTVPALKLDPGGLFTTPPFPDPFLEIFNV
jgi:hypothetical protein